jgi:hypothetical protein
MLKENGDSGHGHPCSGHEWWLLKSYDTIVAVPFILGTIFHRALPGIACCVLSIIFDRLVDFVLMKLHCPNTNY